MTFLMPLKTSEKIKEIALTLNFTFAGPKCLLTGQGIKQERGGSHKEEIRGTDSWVQIFNNWPMFVLVKLPSTIPALSCLSYWWAKQKSWSPPLICPFKITENVASAQVKNQLTDTQMAVCHFAKRKEKKRKIVLKVFSTNQMDSPLTIAMKV